MIQENDNGWCSWYYWDGGAWEPASDSGCSGDVGTHLEGYLDLKVMAGVTAAADLPASIGFAVGSYGDSSGDALDHTTQDPPTTDSDGDIDAVEVMMMHRASMLVGNVIP